MCQDSGMPAYELLLPWKDLSAQCVFEGCTYKPFCRNQLAVCRLLVFLFFFSFHAVQNMKATSATTSIQDMLAAPFQTSYFDVSGLGDVQLEKVYFTAIPNQEHLVLNAVFFLIYRVMDPQEKYSNGKQNQGVNICSHWYCWLLSKSFVGSIHSTVLHSTWVLNYNNSLSNQLVW